MNNTSSLNHTIIPSLNHKTSVNIEYFLLNNLTIYSTNSFIKKIIQAINLYIKITSFVFSGTSVGFIMCQLKGDCLYVRKEIH